MRVASKPPSADKIDTRLTSQATPLPGQVVLVLQGGGALGAYQAGVYQALHEAGIEPDWIIGTSIGAINASLIAGNEAPNRLPRLEEFWGRMADKAFWHASAAWAGAGQPLSYWTGRHSRRDRADSRSSTPNCPHADEGHTPGHICVVVGSPQASVVLSGDIMHTPLQCAEPQLNSCFRVDAERARTTRRRFLETFADSPVMVIPAHFPTPTAGWIRSHDGSFRFHFDRLR